MLWQFHVPKYLFMEGMRHVQFPDDNLSVETIT